MNGQFQGLFVGTKCCLIASTIVILAATVGIARADSVCEDIAGFNYSVAKARDGGVPMDFVLRVVNQGTWPAARKTRERVVVIMIYSHPEVSPAQVHSSGLQGCRKPADDHDRMAKTFFQRESRKLCWLAEYQFFC